jgi:hypothetical protein
MRQRGGHRYGAVLVITLAMATFTLAAPDGTGMHLVELAVAGAALMAAMLTSGARPAVRRATHGALLLALLLAVAAAVAGARPGVLALSATAVANGATIAVILGGLVRLVRDEGSVGVQAVFGAMAIYLLLGLAFGFVVGAIATGADGAYFAQGTDGVQSQRVYFSYTVMTTTGFGDLTARTAPGRALTVLEMLVGQLYLVTVIATLVGNLRRRER